MSPKSESKTAKAELGRAEALALRELIAMERALRFQPPRWPEVRDGAIRLAALAANRATRKA